MRSLSTSCQEALAMARQEPVSRWCGSLLLARPSLSEPFATAR
ncbi:hypothetical protein L195_g062895 [Trifolium pratense]|uniref:Uncharacterized protein n=1 Tax=Trifolium pratense TaxID=57577 RepID=A0A2K3KIK3_TRIPR|nr:hypothetical protein L195_g062895 [Trifolium pratense]